MKAVVYDKKSTPDRLVFSEVDRPVPDDNEVLIKVHAVSLNAADYRSMKMGIIPRGKIFGADIAGRIEETGKNISLFRPGDEVLGDLADSGFGGLAEYVTAPGHALVRKPAGVSFETAASLPMAAITALQALRDKGNIRKGQKVLIIGCAGGVGTFAVQLARYFETEVTGICSTKNVEQSLSLGAHYVIDYTRENFTAGGMKYDIILAVNGNYSLLACKKALNPGGVYVMVGGSLSQVFRSIFFGRLMSPGTKKMKFMAARTNKADLEMIVSLAEKGYIRPVIEKRFPLEKTAEAMNYLNRGHASGKIVIFIEE